MRYQFTWTSGYCPDGSTESYNEPDVTDQASAERAAKAMIDDYNSEEMRRYGKDSKTIRTITKVEFLGDNANQEHDWGKVNLVTHMGDGHGARDKWRCKRCGCEALRYGLSGTFKRIGEWRAQKYRFCKST